MFFKIDVFKNFAFLITLKARRPATLLKETPTEKFLYEYYEIL